ncbi:MAG: aldehyde ferredoxin oxidoreductase C-terminal domain-containing protein [Chloroflexota bacterium]
MSQLAVDLNDSPNDRGVSVFGNWEQVDWDEIDAVNFARGGAEYYDKYYHARVGCVGCPIFRCYRICNDPETGLGTAKCYSQPMFTFRVWNRDWQVMEAAGHLCNNYGLDVLSTANIIAFLMELYHRGIITEEDTDGIPMKRGDKEAIISTIHKLARQEGFGKLFRDGVMSGARKIGRGAEEFAMSVKGQEMGLHEFRGRKGTALVLAAGTKRGGGEYPHPESIWSKSKVSKEAVYPSSYENKAEVVCESTYIYMIVDMLGICKNYFSWAFNRSLEFPIKLFSLATGKDASVDELIIAAKRVQVLERAFDVTRGIRRKDDTLPKRIFETPVPGGPFKGETLEKDKFEILLGEYYELCGWDEDGVPKKETFEKYGLSSEWQAFEKRLKKEGVARG